MLPERLAHPLCARCVAAFKPNVGRRCRLCDLPGGQHACLQCPCASGAITQMRLPLVATPMTTALLEAGRTQGRAEIWRHLAQIIAADVQAQTLARGALCLVPIASDAARLHQRGFNPSASLARHLGRAWHMRVAYVLKRTRAGVRQRSCKPNQRRHNRMAAFMCVKPSAHTVALVDDDVVTGATVHAAARALRAAGAKRIIVIGAVRGEAR